VRVLEYSVRGARRAFGTRATAALLPACFLQRLQNFRVGDLGHRLRLDLCSQTCKYVYAHARYTHAQRSVSKGQSERRKSHPISSNKTTSRRRFQICAAARQSRNGNDATNCQQRVSGAYASGKQRFLDSPLSPRPVRLGCTPHCKQSTAQALPGEHASQLSFRFVGCKHTRMLARAPTHRASKAASAGSQRVEP
jgi:hypothetical protein